MIRLAIMLALVSLGESDSAVPQKPVAVTKAAVSVSKAAIAVAKEAVVRIDVSKDGTLIGTGSGFYIGDGMVVTNDHVVNKAQSIALWHESGRRTPVEGCLVRSPVLDLAILAVEGDAPATLTISDAIIEVFDVAAVVGHPGGSDSQLVSDGRIASLKADESPEDNPMLVFTAQIAAGSSGSPILGADGGVIAVAAAQTMSIHPSYLAIYAKHLPALIAKARSASPSSCGPSETGPWLNILISIAFFAFMGGAWWWTGRTRRSRKKR
jgi:S1-C subfamily serine protease